MALEVHIPYCFSRIWYMTAFLVDLVLEDSRREPGPWPTVATNRHDSRLKREPSQRVQIPALLRISVPNPDRYGC